MSNEDDLLLDQALDELVWEDRVLPVRAMETVLAHGDRVGARVLSRFEEELARRDADGNPLWLGVVLGLLGRVEAVPALAAALRQAEREDLALGMVASEALARIGAEAIPALRRFISESHGRERAWGYAALGAMSGDEAYQLLLDALESGEVGTDVVASALADQSRSDAIPLLYQALLRAGPAQRPEIEDAILALYRGERPLGRVGEDWRLRYRRDPKLAHMGLSWCAVEVLAGEAKGRRTLPAEPVPSLDALLARAVEPTAPSELCPDCGGAYFESTGISVCPCAAAEATLLQAEYLEVLAAEEGVDDVFDALNIVDLDLEELFERPAPRGRKARESQEDEIERLMLVRGGLVWLLETGVEDVRRGIHALQKAARRAARLHGTEDALPESGPALRASAPCAGRNDPCPCGSGRKYKRCCGAADASRALGPLAAGRIPSLVTFDGESVSFCRSHYRIQDLAEVATALSRCPELESSGDLRSFVWTSPVDDDKGRLLGSLRITGDGLVLECMSEERLEQGRALIEAAAGPWLTHRADTLQDPWQAVAERGDRGGASAVPSSGLPQEQGAELVRSVLDRHYRTWPDEPLPALGGRTARDTVRTPAGREEVAALLASMEHLEARKPPAQRYDFGWIWKELGVADLR